MMTQVFRRAFTVTAGLACAASLACSFSYGSGSISDSSKSSSGSSADDEKAFRNDVPQHTGAFVEADREQQQTFFSGRFDLARKRGVSDWDSEPSTWQAIGSGSAAPS